MYPDSTVTSTSLLAPLKAIFGFDRFRPHQAEIIQALMNGRDVFAVMPTGGGKSLCYQLPARLLDGTCLVISPLISLMKDQVDAANEVGLKSAFLNSSLNEAEKRDVTGQLKSGGLDLVYIAPERFALNTFINILNDIKLSFVAVDEAHCISEWGHDFRPDYLELTHLTTLFPNIPISAFTATATQRVQSDIIERLRLREPHRVRASFNRPNLHYRVIPRENANRQIHTFLANHSGEPGIIYRTTRKSVESTAQYLNSRGKSTRPYHAGLSDEERKANQEAFNKDEIQIIVATIAFGMGIDKSNVRFIIHADLPKNMEGYYQETGRAGRDGEPAQCLLLFSRGDIPKIRHFIDKIPDARENALALANLQRMANYASVNSCRRKQILEYFDEAFEETNCGSCDVCNGEIELTEALESAQKILSAIVRTGQRFGAVHIIDIVTGSDTQKIRQFNHHNLVTFGVGSDRDKRYWRTIIDELLAQDYLTRSAGQFPTLQLYRNADRLLTGKEKFYATGRKEIRASEKIVSAPDNFNPSLFERLRALRMSLAKRKRVPPFVIFSDRTLKEMASLRPANNIELLGITGVGARKMKQYGEVFLKEIGAWHQGEQGQITA